MLLLVSALTVSVMLNVYLVREALRLKKAPAESYEVKDLLCDLASGPAIVEMKRIDPASVLLRRRQ